MSCKHKTGHKKDIDQIIAESKEIFDSESTQGERQKWRDDKMLDIARRVLPGQLTVSCEQKISAITSQPETQKRFEEIQVSKKVVSRIAKRDSGLILVLEFFTTIFSLLSI